MNIKPHVASGLTVILVLSVISVPSALGKKRNKRGNKVVVVGTDPAADWGGGGVPPEIGDALGQDLTQIEIRRKGKIRRKGTTLNFVIRVNQLPEAAAGFTTYAWFFSTGEDSDWYLTSDECAAFPACVETNPEEFTLLNCSSTQTLVVGTTGCDVVATVPADFDTAAGTITIPITTSDLDLARGDRIKPPENGTPAQFAVTASSRGYVDSGAGSSPYDSLMMTGTFVLR